MQNEARCMPEERLILVRPCPEMRTAAEEYKEEHHAAGEYELHGGAAFERMEYEPWLRLVEQNSRRETVRPDWMLSSTFFVCLASTGRIVGMLDIRHELNDFGRRFAGHIGYGVRPSCRRRGYATQILRMALEYAAGIGIAEAMVNCYSDNLASRRTIERCGGRLDRSFAHTKGRTVCVYLVPTGIQAECACPHT